MFHLYLVISLDNGKTFKFEKNHIPEISMGSDAGKETMAVSTPSNLSFDEFVKKGESKAGGTKLWVYDAFSANCQCFVRDLLRGAGVWTSALNSFVMQDAFAVIKGFSWFQKLTKKVTDAANVADVVAHGEGQI